MNEHLLNKLELKEHFEGYMDSLDHCECDDPDCKRSVVGKPHHRLPQTQLYRKLYKEYIDDPVNLLGMSNYCHIHAENIDEQEFCDDLNDKYPDLNIKPRSKSGKNKEINR